MIPGVGPEGWRPPAGGAGDLVNHEKRTLNRQESGVDSI